MDQNGGTFYSSVAFVVAGVNETAKMRLKIMGHGLLPSKLKRNSRD